MTETMKRNRGKAKGAYKASMGGIEPGRCQGAHIGGGKAAGGPQSAQKGRRDGDRAHRSGGLGRSVHDIAIGQADALVGDMYFLGLKIYVTPAEAAYLATAQAEDETERQGDAVRVVFECSEIDEHISIRPGRGGVLLVRGPSDLAEVKIVKINKRAAAKHIYQFRGARVTCGADIREKVPDIFLRESLRFDLAHLGENEPCDKVGILFLGSRLELS